MPKQLRIRPQAQIDILELANFLDRHSTRTGDRFYSECEATFQLLLISPGIGSLYQTTDARNQGMRVFPIREFPNHLVFYFSKESGIEVVRVLHGARDLDSALRNI